MVATAEALVVRTLFDTRAVSMRTNAPRAHRASEWAYRPSVTIRNSLIVGSCTIISYNSKWQLSGNPGWFKKRLMLKQIYWAYQRVRYGYDDSMFWSFDYTLARLLREQFVRYMENGYEPLTTHTNKEAVDIIDRYLDDTIPYFSEEYEEASKDFSQLVKRVGDNITRFWY